MHPHRAVVAADPSIARTGELLQPEELAALHRLGLLTVLPGLAAVDGPHAGARLLAVDGAAFTPAAYVPGKQQKLPLCFVCVPAVPCLACGWVCGATRLHDPH